MAGRTAKKKKRKKKRSPPLRDLPDRDLVALCLDGDEAAWQALLSRYVDLIYAISLRRGLGREMAEEVFQSVSATLAERLHLVEDPDCLPKWIMITTARRCTRLRERHDKAIRPRPPAGPEPEHDPEEWLVQEDLYGHILDALQELPDRDRELLLDLFQRELPYSEAAARHGLARGSLGALRARILERVRRILRERGVL
jgi:RNA polymerase sigma factor (sigma-70 family)